MTTPRTIELPDFDTGQYEGARFVMEDGDAHLTITIAEVGDARFTFRRARWHQFTSLHSERSDRGFRRSIEAIQSALS